MKIVWREWYNASDVAALTRMKTLPREEIEIPMSDGYTRMFMVRELARHLNAQDAEFLRNGGKLVILEPEKYAGTFDITVDYEPVFTAYQSEVE